MDKMSRGDGEYVCSDCGFINENPRIVKRAFETDYKAKDNKEKVIVIELYQKMWFCSECSKRHKAGITRETEVKDIDNVPHQDQCQYCGEKFYGKLTRLEYKKHVENKCEEVPWGEMRELVDMRFWRGNKIEKVTSKTLDLSFSENVYKLELEHNEDEIHILIAFNEKDDWPERVYVKEQVRWRDKLLGGKEKMIMTKDEYQETEYGVNVGLVEKILAKTGNKARDEGLETIDKVINAKVDI